MKGFSVFCSSKVKASFQIALLMCILVLTLLELVGFPHWMTQIATEQISKGNFVIEASGMSMDMLSGVYLEDVQMYRKKVVGPPAISAKGMRIRLNPLAAISGKNSSPVAYIELLDGDIKPAQAFGVQSGAKSEEPESLDVVLTRMSVTDIMIESFSGKLVSDGSSVLLTNIVSSISGQYGEGTATGWVRKDNAVNVTNGRIVTDMDPHFLVTGLKSIEWDYPVKLIDRFEWGIEKPLVDTVFTMTGSAADKAFSSRSLFSMKNYTYRGVSNDTCDGSVALAFDHTSGVVNVENIIITIDDGAIVGGVAYDDTLGQVSYRTVTDVNPRDFFQMVGLFESEEMVLWQFPGRTRLISEGVVNFDNSDKTKLSAQVDSSGMGFGRLIADQCTFDVDMQGSTCRLTNIRGSIWDGDIEGSAQIEFPEDSPGHVSFSSRLSGCDFTKVACEVCGTTTNSMSGVFSMHAQGGFLLTSNALQTMTAFGSATVTEGRIFQLPIFGGFTRIMTKIIPGLDFVLRQGDMNAEFKVEDSKVSSEKIAIDGGVLSLKAKGGVTLDGELDYIVQVTLMSEHGSVAKLLRVITWPISKLMEFRLKGTVKEPEWYPVNFSSELLERIGLMKGPESE